MVDKPKHCGCSCHYSDHVKHVAPCCYPEMFEADESYDNWGGVEFSIEDKTTWPVLVISSTIEAGKKYAENLGLVNYTVRNSLNKIEGMRMRALVVTPGYISKTDRAAYDARNVYDGAIQAFAMSTKDWG